MSLKTILSVFVCIVVAANVEALFLGSRHAMYSPRRSMLSSVSDADTVNIGFGGSGRRINSLSALSNLGIGLGGRRSIRSRFGSGLRRGNSNIVVLGGGDIDFPSVEYGNGFGGIGGIGSLGGISDLSVGGISGLGGGLSRFGGLGGYGMGGDADHVTVPRGTNLRLAARAGLFEDVDQISVI